MEINTKYIEHFLSEFHSFVEQLHSIKPTNETLHFIQNYDLLDKNEIVTTCAPVILQYRDRIIAKDETIFTKKFLIIKTINVSYFWKHSDQSFHENIWTTLKRFIVHIRLICNVIDDKHASNVVTPEPDTIPEFNPYVGIGSDTGLSVNDLVHNVSDTQGDGNTFVNNMLSQIGINTDEMSDKLKNIDSSTLDKIPGMIQGMLGQPADPAMDDMLKDMVGNVGRELKKNDISKGNIFENMVGVAQKLSLKYADAVQHGVDLPIEKLVSSTQTLMQNFGLPQNVNDVTPTQLMGLLASVSNMQNNTNVSK